MLVSKDELAVEENQSGNKQKASNSQSAKVPG